MNHRSNRDGALGRSAAIARGLRRLAATALLVAIAAGAPVGTAVADDYDPSMAGHPLRIVAYVLHPVGVAIDYLLLRPAHWIVSHEPMQTLFGHEDD